VNFGPLAFRSGNRAVTLNDFVSLAQNAGGVAKVRARSQGWNLVELFVAPEGDTLAPVPPPLKQRLVDYFEDKRMVGTFVEINDANPVGIDIHVDIVVEHNFDPALVQASALKAVQAIVAFANVDFGQPLYLSKVYEAIESVSGVLAANVTRFRRADRAAVVAQQISQIPASVMKAVPDLLDRLLNVDVEADGRIEIGDQELPVPGTIDVGLQGTLD
jgi:hypothetical protein